MALTGSVEKYAPGPPAITGSSMGWRPALSGMRASTRLMATRSTDTSDRPLAWPRHTTRSGRVSSSAPCSRSSTSLNTQGSWRAATVAPPMTAPSSRRAASQEGLMVSPSKGSIPVSSTVGMAWS